MAGDFADAASRRGSQHYRGHGGQSRPAAENLKEKPMAFLRQLLSRDNKIQIIGTWDL